MKQCECNWEKCAEVASSGTPDWGKIKNENTDYKELFLCPKHRAEAIV